MFSKTLIFLTAVVILQYASVSNAGPGEKRYKYTKTNLKGLRGIEHRQHVDGPPHMSSTGADLPRRVEISQFRQNQPLWELYVLALDWLHGTPEDDPFSYFRLMGIHGAPYQDWPVPKDPAGLQSTGYCVHVNQIFLTWHRPFLALYEQTLYTLVRKIAGMYNSSDRQRYLDAVPSFRLPYWDWALNSTNQLGSYITDSQVSINGPDGVQNISNPLYSYIFDNLNNTGFTLFPYTVFEETKRNAQKPFTGVSPSDNTALNADLNNQVVMYQQRLHTLFTKYDHWTNFSSEQWIQGFNPSTKPWEAAMVDSLESLHDTVHITIGSYDATEDAGHMYIIDYSAFEPLFMLHHVNVDRLTAMWQIVHRDSWVGVSNVTHATRTMPVNSVVDSSTDLTPFLRQGGGYWNSDLVRDWTLFNYDYDDTANQDSDMVQDRVNTLYGQFSLPKMVQTQRNQTRGLLKQDNKLQKRSDPLSSMLDAIHGKGRYNEWVVNILVDKHSLGATFVINFCLGYPGASGTNRPCVGEMIGRTGIWGGSQATMDSVRVGSTVPLTYALTRLVSEQRISCLDDEDVAPFLRDQLNFSIMIASTKTYVEPRNVKGLQISVVRHDSILSGLDTDDGRILSTWDSSEVVFYLYEGA